MLKSDLVHALAQRNPEWSAANINAAVQTILDGLANTLSDGGRIEVRGFGSFKLVMHAARNSRNPRTGEKIMTPAKVKVHFKPGQIMRSRLQSLDLHLS